METYSRDDRDRARPCLVAGDAGRMTGERQERPDPEVPEKACRRTFTAQYKLDVVAEYDAAPAGPSNWWRPTSRSSMSSPSLAPRSASCRRDVGQERPG